MRHRQTASDPFQSPPLRHARAMLLVAGALTILLIGATLADLWLRASAQDQQARRWLHALSLSTPALWPAGTVLRHPEMTHPGVCPYFSPGLATAP